MADNFINQYPSSVPGTSSGATMVSFSGGSPSTPLPAGHEYTSSFPEFILGDIPTNPVSHTQYQWPPPFATPTSDTVASSHVSQLSGPPHIRLMYSSSLATLEQQTISPTMAIPPMRPPSPPQNEIPPLPAKPPTRHRKRIHSCSMCEKAFDRPSTLKKHMLVHTGEKSHVCEICSRRFSVASNLNRHVRRCVLRPVNTLHNAAAGSGQPPGQDTASATSSHTARSGSEGCSTGTLSETALSPRSTAPSPKRTSTSDFTCEAGVPRPAKKRPRRAPTPTPWIPQSLRDFDLTPSRKSCPIPLAPVRPSSWEEEERDSFLMDDMPHNPYHPDGWVGRLPGPACRPIHTGILVQRIELY